MEEVIKIFKELQNNSGKKLQEILENNKDNELLKDILYFVYNPYITTGLSKNKINKIVPTQMKYRPAENIYNIFYHLEKHPTGTDIDIAYVLEFISEQKEEYKELYKQIFTKELKLGITAKTINKVWKGLIPEFNVMLAEKYWDRINELEKNKPNIIITQKLDGIRCIGMVDRNRNVTLYSRQGKEIIGLLDIKKELSRLFPGYYDGELLLDKDDIPSKDLYRETVTIVNSKEENKQNIIFNIFDYCSLDEFIQINGSKIPCDKRKKYIYEKLRKIESKWLSPVPILYYGIFNKEIVNEQLDKQILLEHEGIMINIADAPYESKRTKNILKVKKIQSTDLKIIGFEEGTGKNKGNLGAIIVNYKNNKVGVGSGFTDEDRVYIWNNRDNLLDTICEIQYFEETKNQKDDLLSLRFPVFLRFRPDKSEESYY